MYGHLHFEKNMKRPQGAGTEEWSTEERLHELKGKLNLKERDNEAYFRYMVVLMKCRFFEWEFLVDKGSFRWFLVKMAHVGHF